MHMPPGFKTHETRSLLRIARLGTRAFRAASVGERDNFAAPARSALTARSQPINLGPGTADIPAVGSNSGRRPRRDPP